MPKHAIHHIVLNEARGHLFGSPNAEVRAAGEDLASNMPLSNLGAIGPDLFFWAPDYEFVDVLYTLYENFSELKQVYDRIMAPIRAVRDAVVEPVEDAVETLLPDTVALIRRLIEEMQETTRLFQATISSGLFAGVIVGADLITDAAGFPSLASQFFQQNFEPPLQHARPNNEENCWYWFDMLHYRRTGVFGRQLVTNARAGTQQQRAYAFGYLSHIATDLVGHGYVNQIVGGPYRLHVQRHATVENWLDTWKFFYYYGGSVNLELFDRLALDPTLDTSVGDLLYQTLDEVYRDVDHPRRLRGNEGFLTREQIDETYDAFYRVLELLKNQAVARPEEPFSGAADILKNALEDLLQGPPGPPRSPRGACSVTDIFAFGLTASSRECYEEFHNQLSEWFGYLGELLAWAFETLLDLFDLLLTLLLSLPIAVLLAILYGLQLLLYEILQTVRLSLALTGFICPEPADLMSAHGHHLTTPSLCGLGGCPAPERAAVARLSRDFALPNYPRLTNLTVSHLVCPPPNTELPGTWPNFAPPGDPTTPDTFIIEQPFSLDALSAYAASRNPRRTAELYSRCTSIGNATELSAWMIGVAADSDAPEDTANIAHTNWNLDSDRGYAYKTWAGTLPFDPVHPLDVTYVDERTTPGLDEECRE